MARDGTFRIGTKMPGDGAPVGEYAVTIVWPKLTEEGGEVVEGKDQLLDRYRDPQNPASRITVREGENVLPPLKLNVP